MTPTSELFLLQTERLVADGKHPAVLGTALAELVAAHIAGARPDLRDQARRQGRIREGRDLGGLELLECFRAMNPVQRNALLEIARSITANNASLASRTQAA